MDNYVETKTIWSRWVIKFSTYGAPLMHLWCVGAPLKIDHNPILGIGLALACNGGSCGENTVKQNKHHLHLKRPPA